MREVLKLVRGLEKGYSGLVVSVVLVGSYAESDLFAVSLSRFSKNSIGPMITCPLINGQVIFLVVGCLT